MPNDPSNPDPLDALVGRLRARDGESERYVVVEEVGRGGMGIVFRVHDTILGRDLAMKVTRGEAAPAPAASPRKLSRFLAEAQVAGQLDHPGIVPIHDVGVDRSGAAYITMKMVEGVGLDEVFRRLSEGRDGWTLPRVVGVLLRVCEAMAFAHARGVVHRDLKPANIMVGRFGEVFVTDWGLARLLDETPSSRGVRESPRRIAPGTAPIL
jgi:serine/threonine-protein kinase